MVAALRASFQHYAADPRKNNTVPGQFGEYFDGESLINRGMRLSPWEPPRYFWATIEGVCGVMLTTGALRVAPLVLASWKWVALKRLPYHGREITYVAARRGGAFHLYAVGDVECDFPMQRYETDVSTSVVAPSGASIVVLVRADETLVFVGSHDEGTYTIGLSSVLSLGRSYNVETYDSERDAWQSTVIDTAIPVDSIGLSIEPGGYRIISLRSPRRNGIAVNDEA